MLYNSAKQILNLDIKTIEGKMHNLKKSSESLDEKFVKLVKDAVNSPNASILIYETNALKWKNEEQVLEINKLEDTLKGLQEK